ncbi:hypothetical protein BDF20DRAFT_879027 [Mycotypha africana]|uniref:uncharacterized protein n=1 Tax=Mycotypha africana TaxID=64632 RepID=UPI0022FFF41E|nr:uncharacterized protein BDF20DRAFT_879027 [Mycotypha africana]KAI8975492.1 hypothetical protein BDF20DRAFT_879027 [Mycotypha africana]
MTIMYNIYCSTSKPCSLFTAKELLKTYFVYTTVRSVLPTTWSIYLLMEPQSTISN